MTALTWAGGSVSMVCYQDGSTATGAYTSNRWFYLTQGTLRGWAHSSRVTNQVSVPNCSTHRGVSTATWAARRHGETSATQAQADWMWGAGTDPRWSGGCAGFVSAAYYFGAGVTNLRHRGNARPMYLDFLADEVRMRSMSTTPSIGAAVFLAQRISALWPHVVGLDDGTLRMGPSQRHVSRFAPARVHDRAPRQDALTTAA